MRPPSEIHSALALCESELERLGQDAPGRDNLMLARDVLAWACGGRAPMDGPNAWLAAYLLPDPPKVDPTPPDVN